MNVKKKGIEKTEFWKHNSSLRLKLKDTIEEEEEEVYSFLVWKGLPDIDFVLNSCVYSLLSLLSKNRWCGQVVVYFGMESRKLFKDFCLLGQEKWAVRRLSNIWRKERELKWMAMLDPRKQVKEEEF